jgi:hypothetical protein
MVASQERAAFFDAALLVVTRHRGGVRNTCWPPGRRKTRQKHRRATRPTENSTCPPASRFSFHNQTGNAVKMHKFIIGWFSYFKAWNRAFPILRLEIGKNYISIILLIFYFSILRLKIGKIILPVLFFGIICCNF